MAKSVLLGVLTDFLGKFVDDLTEENLKIAVWNGVIQLDKIKIKKSAFDSLKLPVSIEKATVQALKLTIPWASLDSKPVIIALDGILVQASPLELSAISVGSARESFLQAKRQQLHKVERAILDKLRTVEEQQDMVKQATYIQQLTTKIIDNLEVTLTNIHIRYEDSVSVPNNPFACGVTIERISLATTDESWTPGFVTRDAANKANTSVHKLGTMEGLGIYWNSADCQLSQRKNFEEWVAYMLAMVKTHGKNAYLLATDSQHWQHGKRPGKGTAEDGRTSTMAEAESPCPLEPMSYILSPANHVEVRVVHREKSTEESPKVDVTMLSSTLPFLITDKQYTQMRILAREFRILTNRKMMIAFRPSLRPTASSEAARAWWKYAYKLVSGRHSLTFRKVGSLMLFLFI